ncbi:Hypothetical predicted protein [Cloeon dipterum]|uniref:Adhesive plaque matrix protein-like n=2 Tax=Cloeon dipterum TaxID=197152 RepID=A0A8S1CUT6_9INSE|nr:Hypothetical predicted protein [Cloeon dipterum]
MRCTLLVLMLSIAVAIVSCQRPVRPLPYRPLRRGPPPITQRRDLAYKAGPPYSKRVRPHMMVTRPKKHITSTSIMGHPSVYSSVYKYPPPPHSRPYMAGPPGPPKSYNRPYGSPNKYPYYGKPSGYSKKQRQPMISHEQVPKETIAQFHSPKPSSNKGTPILTYNGNSNRPSISYGSSAKKPFYNSYDSNEDQSSSEEVYGTQQVGASIKYGKTTPGAAGPAHPSLLDPEVNIKFPGPAFTSATHAYKTINDKPAYQQGGQHHTETSVVKFQDNPSKRRRPIQYQDESQSTKSTVTRPYSTLKFPDSSESGDATSYQNYDHFLQETFAPDLTQQSPSYTKTKQQKKNRGKSRYRSPSHYEVKDESEERGDFYSDSETVEDY